MTNEFWRNWKLMSIKLLRVLPYILSPLFPSFSFSLCMSLLLTIEVHPEVQRKLSYSFARSQSSDCKRYFREAQKKKPLLATTTKDASNFHCISVIIFILLLLLLLHVIIIINIIIFFARFFLFSPRLKVEKPFRIQLVFTYTTKATKWIWCKNFWNPSR